MIYISEDMSSAHIGTEEGGDGTRMRSFDDLEKM
jgi:hypothetical protein